MLGQGLAGGDGEPVEDLGQGEEWRGHARHTPTTAASARIVLGASGWPAAWASTSRGRLPTCRELSDLYQVSVTTVQRAVIILQDRGLVVGLQGRGLWVAERQERKIDPRVEVRRSRGSSAAACGPVRPKIGGSLAARHADAGAVFLPPIAQCEAGVRVRRSDRVRRSTEGRVRPQPGDV
ncbi:GntR family transcriptional regulator [Micromonospora qiuiae]|uniref:GntR family transcriptional regulator n=1 Tax=Micromonospora qiuiae TaxID=502268 RepID=UPI001EF39262|nr:GntR family transcriptional regulator [Micromonospora qiuiae]